MILDISLEEFYEVIMEATMVSVTVKINNKEYAIDTECTKEACTFDIYDVEYNEAIGYDVFLDIDNLRSKASIKKALREYLKENAI